MAKSSSIASVAQTGNVSACLTHSSAPWILDTGVSDHISGNKDLFSSLTFLSPLPTITLANGSKTIAKGIDSVCPLPSLPLTSVLYVCDALISGGQFCTFFKIVFMNSDPNSAQHGGLKQPGSCA